MDALVYDSTGQAINTALGDVITQIDGCNTALDTLTTNIGLYADDINAKIKKCESIYDAIDAISTADNGAALHNWIYRGKNLGTTLTTEQTARIADGTFKGLFAGDYWEKSITFSYPDYTKTDDALTTVTQTVRMIIGECDYRYLKAEGGTNQGQVTSHHVCVIPSKAFFCAPYNTTKTAEGGYVGSKMYTVYLAGGLNAFNAFFGSSHLLPYGLHLTNSVDTEGKPNGLAYTTGRKVDLMNQTMMFGWHSAPFRNDASTHNVAQDYTQLAAFRLNPRLMFTRTNLFNGHHLDWLRDVNGGGFTGIYIYGLAGGFNSASKHGVRPAALIY